MLNFFLATKAGRICGIAILLFLAFTFGAATAGLKVMFHYKEKIAIQEAIYQEQVRAAGEHAKAVDVVVVTKYVAKKEKIEDKKNDIDKQIDSVAEKLRAEDQRCPIGGDFVRLYNDATRPVPDAGKEADGATTKRAARPDSR